MAETVWDLVRERSNELVKTSHPQDTPFWALVGLLEGFGNDLSQWEGFLELQTLKAVGDLVLEGLDFYEKHQADHSSA